MLQEGNFVRSMLVSFAFGAAAAAVVVVVGVVVSFSRQSTGGAAVSN